MLDVQEICQRLNDIAGKVHVLGQDFHLVSLVEPQNDDRIVVEAGDFHANFLRIFIVLRLKVCRQQEILFDQVRSNRESSSLAPVA